MLFHYLVRYLLIIDKTTDNSTTTHAGRVYRRLEPLRTGKKVYVIVLEIFLHLMLLDYSNNSSFIIYLILDPKLLISLWLACFCVFLGYFFSQYVDEDIVSLSIVEQKRHHFPCLCLRMNTTTTTTTTTATTATTTTERERESVTRKNRTRLSV